MCVCVCARVHACTNPNYVGSYNMREIYSAYKRCHDIFLRTTSIKLTSCLTNCSTSILINK